MEQPPCVSTLELYPQCLATPCSAFPFSEEKGKVKASSSFLEQKFQDCSKRGVGLATIVETLLSEHEDDDEAAANSSREEHFWLVITFMEEVEVDLSPAAALFWVDGV